MRKAGFVGIVLGVLGELARDDERGELHLKGCFESVIFFYTQNQPEQP